MNLSIVAGFPKTVFVPQVSFASFVGPRCIIKRPKIVIAKVPCRIGFQSDQGIFRLFSSNANDHVDMVRPDIDREKSPTAFLACVSN